MRIKSGDTCVECGLPVTRAVKVYAKDKTVHSVTLRELLSTCLRLNVSVTHQALKKEIPVNG